MRIKFQKRESGKLKLQYKITIKKCRYFKKSNKQYNGIGYPIFLFLKTASLKKKFTKYVFF